MIYLDSSGLRDVIELARLRSTEVVQGLCSLEKQQGPSPEVSNDH